MEHIEADLNCNYSARFRANYYDVEKDKTALNEGTGYMELLRTYTDLKPQIEYITRTASILLYPLI